MRPSVPFAVALASAQLACATARPSAESLVHGSVAPGFEEVREQFVRNFAERDELGAACTVYFEGRKVVDLWGGWRDPDETRPWEEDTMVLFFSTTKGLSAMALALAHSRGLLDYDAPVARYWPEFAQHGKQSITVRQLLAHQAGLPTPDQHIELADLADLDRLARILERQQPAWTPGAACGYHAATLGLYENELLRRVDPKGRSLPQFFQEEIAAPLGLELYIGLPPSVPDARLATIDFYSPLGALFNLPLGKTLSFVNPGSRLSRTLRIPYDAMPYERRFVSVASPSVNGVGQVRSVARAYAAFAAGGAELGLSPRTFAELTAPALAPPEGPRDRVLDLDLWFSLGFSKPGPKVEFGSSWEAFGTPGMGGSFGFADPRAQVGFAYAMNRLGYGVRSDPRLQALVEATYRCVRRLEARRARSGDDR